MKVEYSSNNSGGSWWLKDADWKKLAAAGWDVKWGGEYFCHAEYSFREKPKGKPEPCADSKSCKGHRMFDTPEEMPEDRRWLGALAHDAEKDFPSLADAIREWEKVLGMDASETGCNCCGPPHSFKTSDPYEYVSGEEVIWALHPRKARKSLRELVEDE